MNVRRMIGASLVGGLCLIGQGRAQAQCCLNDLFAGCASCFNKPPRVAPLMPVAPVAAPIMAPVAAPPVMVPMQQTSYVPETTYRTEYRNVPVTTYKPSCEIDPCTGCPVECMQPVTQYVQQAVNVPVTQYRAVTSTQYVQMQPGSVGAPAYAPPAAGAPAAVAPAASPFSAVQTTPQAWGAAGADVSRQPLPGVAPPSLPATAAPATTYQSVQPQFSQPQQQYVQPQFGQPQQQYVQPQFGQPQQQYVQPQFGQPQAPSSQPIIPQAGTYASPAQTPGQFQAQPQPTQPPALSPAPSLRPIPEMPRNGSANGNSAGTDAFRPRNGNDNGSGGNSDGTSTDRGTQGGASLPGGLEPGRGEPAAPTGMPLLPGTGPGPATGAFPRLLEPTGHTTSWGPSDGGGQRVQYPMTALPAWRQAQR